MARIIGLPFIFFLFFSGMMNTAFGTEVSDTTIHSKKIIYKFYIDKEIAPPVWRTTKEAFIKAREAHADIILIQMNTYGGLLDAADSIRTRILKSEIPVYVFVDHNAASAGALISIACDSIYMTKEATIGAATVVNQSGEVVPDKYQSYMRAMMRATAEATGRDPEIAQAMVDPRISIAGVIDSGSVLTFTATEALKYGYCNGIAENTSEVLKLAGITDYQIIDHHETATDKFIGFLINPIISSILIIIIIAGIYFEFQTPGIGFPIIAAIIAALLYFAPLYIEGLANNWEILLFIAGLILLAVEIFVIPGFGVTGILGITFIVAGLTLAMVGNVGFDFSNVKMVSLVTSFFLVIISMFAAILISYLTTRALFSKNKFFGSLALETVQKSSEGYSVSDKGYRDMVGRTGVAYTILRPAGKVKIGDEVFDATALSSYIDRDEPVEVARYESGQLFVRKIDLPSDKA